MQANACFPGQSMIPKSKSRETASHTSLNYNSKTGKPCDELMTGFHKRFLKNTQCLICKRSAFQSILDCSLRGKSFFLKAHIPQRLHSQWSVEQEWHSICVSASCKIVELEKLMIFGRNPCL